MTKQDTTPRTIVDEFSCAEFIGLTVGFLRKDRCTKRTIPFFRIGGPIRGAIRYDLQRVREALLALEEGGTAPKPRTRKNTGGQR